MKKVSKFSLGLVALLGATALGIFGTTAGTLAWYVYSVSSGFSFVGTSVAKSALLKIGIVDDNHYITDTDLTTYHVERVEVEGHSIVFTQSSSGLDSRLIKDFLFWTEYNSSMLFPVTTKARTATDQSPLTLYQSPDFADTDLTVEASKSDYVRIPFAFMVDNKTDTVINTDVWLTETIIRASGKDIDQAVRICVENDQRRFIFKPADRTTTIGGTKVGGLLDLNKDGFYDFDDENKEMYYGEYNGTLTYNGPYPYEEDECDYDNVNGVTYTHKSTFYAKHKKGIYTANLSDVTPKLAEYHTFGTVKPQTDANGDYYEGTTGKKICSTDSVNGIGYATFTIYIEGWDHVIIDEASEGYNFSLNLRFEMNRL